MKRILSLAAITLLALSFALGVSAQGKKSGKACSMRASGCCFTAVKDVKREARNTKDGVIIDFTSGNPESVKALQEIAASCKRMKSKTCSMKGKMHHGCCSSIKDSKCTVRNLKNGVEVSRTSSNAETVKALQKKAACCGDMKSKACSMKGKNRGGCCGCCMALKDVKCTIRNTKDGVVMTMTSSNAESVKALQKKAASCREMKNKTCPMKARMHRGCCKALKDVKCASRNIDNGVEMTMTSGNPESVKAIQEKAVSCTGKSDNACTMHMRKGCCRMKGMSPGA